ncbi:MAG: choice-of-anchor R domain-containing protein [Telluria sp.]
MKNFTRWAAALALCAGAPAWADGMLVYDNGLPDHQSGNNLGFAWQAEDFSVGTAATVGRIRFWTLEAPGAYRGRISWEIRADAGGAPGSTVLGQGTNPFVDRLAQGAVLGLGEYRNAFDLNIPLDLQPGTYWLVLHNGSPNELNDPNEFLWETTAPNGTVRGMESFDGTHYSSNFNEHAFAITAVPEPLPATTLALGLGVLWSLRRRLQA